MGENAVAAAGCPMQVPCYHLQQQQQEQQSAENAATLVGYSMKKDITKAIERIEIFYFLVDIVLKDEIREEGTGFGPSMLGSTSSGVQNFYPAIGQTVAPSKAMIRRIATSGVQNFYPPMGQTAPSEVMIRRTVMPKVFPFVYIQRQAWQAAKDNTSASKGRSG
ncbi:hypothetical protein T459_35445 [Capsicum annuum]|uniref:Uncharacterized protein n=1 Tax=Capsicum annuum TaxID=4072 RepID=A0A2G2XJ95_CAPAN|nr:hypothetical protein T459_35445 [Capsicum annuum]